MGQNPLELEASDSHEPGPVNTDATSLSLLERVRVQDARAWQRLVALYSPLVFSWCRRYDLSREDSSDVLQEVFSAVAEKIARFRRDRSGDTFRGWLRVIARNVIYLYFRRRAGQPQAVGGSTAQVRIQELPDQQGDGDEACYDRKDDSDLFHRGVELIRSEFEERTWQAFWRTVVDQRSAAEVAGSLRMTPGAVRQAKYKVLRRLRDEFGDLLE
jgi:RNA polymerase sigma-70 factor (ECF subfamily)